MIHVVDADPRWPAAFAAERERLQKPLAPWLLAMEHMGSTAVPRLAAKPVIDMLLGVRTLAEADAHAIPALTQLGYTHVPDYEQHFPERRFFFRDTNGVRSHQIHLVSQGSAFWRDHLLFRDYLRSHPQVARDYAAHKQQLAPQFQDTNTYAAAKSNFIVPHLHSARLWRARTSTVLQTPRLQLRLWQPADLLSLSRLNADAEVMQYMPTTLSQDETATILKRLQAHFVEHGFGLWAVQFIDDPTALGWVGLSIPGFAAPFMPCVELEWRLHRRVWGRGLATEAARAAARFAFDVLGLQSVVAFTTPGNQRSRRVMAKLGMQQLQDFEHPALPEGHALRRHVLYRLNAERGPR